MKIYGTIVEFRKDTLNHDEAKIELELSGTEYGGGKGHIVHGHLTLTTHMALLRDFKLGDRFDLVIEKKVE